MKLRDRLSYLPAALGGMAAYVLWQMSIVATGVSRSTMWGIALTLAFGGVIVATGALVLQGRGLLSRTMLIEAAPARIAPAAVRAAGWRFDERSPIKVAPTVDTVVGHVGATIERALVDVLENPLQNPRDFMNGEMVYIQRVEASGVTIEETERPPALLIGYTATTREGAIRVLGVDRAAETSSTPTADDAEVLQALQRVTAIARARGAGHTPVAEH